MDIIDKREFCSGCCYCKANNYVEQTTCMGFIEKSRLGKCVFLSDFKKCDITSKLYDNVIAYNKTNN